MAAWKIWQNLTLATPPPQQENRLPPCWESWFRPCLRTDVWFGKFQQSTLWDNFPYFFCFLPVKQENTIFVFIDILPLICLSFAEWRKRQPCMTPWFQTRVQVVSIIYTKSISQCTACVPIQNLQMRMFCLCQHSSFSELNSTESTESIEFVENYF